MDNKTYTNDLSDLTFTFIELPKFDKTEHELITHIDKWCFFFKHAKETAGLKMDQLMRNYPIVSYAHKTLNEIAMNEEELSIYEGWEKSKLDQINKELFQYEKGKEEGKEEGIKEAHKKMLYSLMEENFDEKTILKIMKISYEDFILLKNELK